MNPLIEKLVYDGVLRSQHLTSAFEKVKREDFVPESIKEDSQKDVALPTFEGQTISQPYTVAFMLPYAISKI